MFEMLFQTIIEITLAVSVIIVLLLIFSKFWIKTILQSGDIGCG